MKTKVEKKKICRVIKANTNKKGKGTESINTSGKAKSTTALNESKELYQGKSCRAKYSLYLHAPGT